ncbi:hypothetical protein, partial [Pseudomonas viridiflava]|uniref:hypothetical protein n=1 Tax=Pseudomonas viridiflava TaxID=33069 RepID=UPI0013DF11F1
MQSHFGNEATPLNRRLTLLLLNQDQPDFLRRALKYYGSFPCSVVLVDTSPEPAAGIAAIADLHYVHAAAFAEKGLNAVLAEGLR